MATDIVQTMIGQVEEQWSAALHRLAELTEPLNHRLLQQFPDAEVDIVDEAVRNEIRKTETGHQPPPKHRHGCCSKISSGPAKSLLVLRMGRILELRDDGVLTFRGWIEVRRESASQPKLRLPGRRHEAAVAGAEVDEMLQRAVAELTGNLEQGITAFEAGPSAQG